MPRIVRPLAVLAVFASLLTGCTSGTVKSQFGERAVVKGKVTVGGKSLTGGTVVFVPVDPSKGDQQVGPIGANGEYITSVFPGAYRVAVIDSRAVPAKFQSPSTSGLEVDVPAGGREDSHLPLN